MSLITYKDNKRKFLISKRNCFSTKSKTTNFKSKREKTRMIVKSLMKLAGCPNKITSLLLNVTYFIARVIKSRKKQKVTTGSIKISCS